MSRNFLHILLTLLLTFTTSVHASSVAKARQQLIENQRNIIYLRKEKYLYQKELLDLDSKVPANTAKIQEIEDNITLADNLISEISLLVSQQRLALATLERGSPPTALDVALNKALSANLPDLARKLSNNKSAKKDISKLRTLLKQQAYVGTPPPPLTQTSVSVANEQQVAEAEFLKLLSLFSAGTADESDDKPIKITWFTDHTPYVEEEMLSYLGHGQYHMEYTVHSGNMTFTIDGRPWQLNIPEAENNSNYVVIYDNAVETKPRLVMFKKSLLLE